MTSKLDQLAEATTLCAYCPKMCRSLCPVAETTGREAVTPWAKMELADAARLNMLPADAAAREVWASCTGCGACTSHCTHGNPVADSLALARAAAPDTRTEQYVQAFAATGDVKGRDAGVVLATMRKEPRARVAYFPGCMRVHRDGAASITNDLRVLSRAFGRDVVVCDLRLGRAQCCGYPLQQEGRTSEVVANFARLSEELAGHETLVVFDPGCAHMLRDVRTQLAPHLSFPHIEDATAALAARAALFQGVASGVRVRIHDPCLAARAPDARGQASVEAVRVLVQAATGQAADEFVSCKEHAMCSGSGGLYPVTHSDDARAIAARRAADTLDPTTLPVLTTCPSARRGFERAGVATIDLATLLLGRA